MPFLAALIFFTRLPWWRLRAVPKEAFEHVVDYWPFIGWLTGGVMAAVFYLASYLGLSTLMAALLTIVSRLLLTGALHEDGLADFCDGFGGGTTRERTLSIMKDSHIGTYGVIGLLFYFGLFLAGLLSLEALPGGVGSRASIIILFDVLAKCAASLITGQLPYARSVEGAKNQVVYAGRSLRQWLSHAVRCTLALSLPIFLLQLSLHSSPCPLFSFSIFQLFHFSLLLLLPFIVELLLVAWMRRRLGGYTGDCCGALFLLCELSLYLSLPLFL